uniref:Uncharacterized protein n=1 Tax=Rhizochromulina marina TaxID=1034831 RepID=A0A7S2W450_9STRA
MAEAGEHGREEYTERMVKLSRRMAYLLRHHQGKTPRDRRCPCCFRGGWMPLEELLFSTTYFSDLRKTSTDDEVRDEVFNMVKLSSGDRKKLRFTVSTVDGVQYVRANYAHSFDVDSEELPLLSVPGDPLERAPPPLRELCLRAVVRNIRRFENIGDLGDDFLLGRIWKRALGTGNLNNGVIKSFATASTESLDLGPVAEIVTNGTLRHILRNCVELRSLSLHKVLAVGEQFLRQLPKKLPSLQHLDLSNCPDMKPSWLLHLGKCPYLQSLDVTHCRGIDSEAALEPFREQLISQSSNSGQLHPRHVSVRYSHQRAASMDNAVGEEENAGEGTYGEKEEAGANVTSRPSVRGSVDRGGVYDRAEVAEVGVGGAAVGAVNDEFELPHHRRKRGALVVFSVHTHTHTEEGAICSVTHHRH